MGTVVERMAISKQECGKIFTGRDRFIDNFCSFDRYRKLSSKLIFLHFFDL